MEQATQEHRFGSQKRLSIGTLVSLMALCVRHASRVSKKLKTKASQKLHHRHLEDFLTSKISKLGGDRGCEWTPRSPLRDLPKELLTSLSNKAMKWVSQKKNGQGGGGASAAEEEEEEEEHGVWQRAILMGDKCQPLDFSGVIYYDCNGRQLKEVPLRSPRASPLPGYLNPTAVRD